MTFHELGLLTPTNIKFSNQQLITKETKEMYRTTDSSFQFSKARTH